MIRKVLLLTVFGLCVVPCVQAQQAADAYYDPDEMAKARAMLKAGHGAQINSLVFGERLEYQSGEGDARLVWEGQGWVGSDKHRLWVKTEGEYESSGSRFEDAELQALYSRAISPFWDLQVGVRHDPEPGPSRSYVVLGAQGLARYWFEVDAALFLSNKGDLSARLEAEYELRLTQRLLLQPRVELNAAFSDDSAIGRGSGLSTAEAGLRLRYEIVREFAPYVGVSWSETLGDSRDFQRLAGEDASEWSFVAGMRFWF